MGEQNKKLWEEFSDIPSHKIINLKTAGGEIHKGHEVKKIPIKYDNEIRRVQFVYAPSIKIPLALGMNFFNAWQMEITRKKNLNLHENDEANSDDENNLNSAEIDEEEWQLSEDQKGLFKNACAYFHFSDGETLGCQKKLTHKIDTGDHAPIFAYPYRYNPILTDKIKEIINRWLTQGVIEKSTSDWRLPIVVVKKSNGSLRLCLDARKLNAITRRDCHTPPNVLHKIENLPHKVKYFFRLDLNEAFL